jgi:penicillin-binding protein 1B
MLKMQKIIIYSLVIVTIAFSLFCGHVWYVWHGFKEIQNNYVLSTHQEIVKKQFILKKNNKILEIDLLRLLPFMDIAQAPEDWLKEQIESGFLLPKQKVQMGNAKEPVFELMENLEFEIESINDCAEIQCYQKRIAFEDIPPALWRGLIGIEDVRFLDHRGVDFRGILRALWVDLKELRLAQGGSTITQQVARNLYLGLEKSFTRKWKEILFSFFMEYQLTKEEILQIYFNEVFWGSLSNVRLRGIYAASVFYFGKKPVDLLPYEVSILVAMLKGPNYFHPLRNTERVTDRANLLLGKLIEMQLVPKSSKPWTKTEWNQWQARLKNAQEDKRFIAITNILKRPESQINNFEEYILISRMEEILAEIKLKPTMQGQEMAFKIFVEDLACVYNQENAQGLSATCPNAFTYYSKQQRSESDAFILESHQVGSLLKPIIYRGLMSMGKSMNDKVSTVPLVLKVRSGTWEPKESATVDFSIKEISLREALQKSRNIPVVRLTEEVGFSYMEEYLFPYIPKLMKPLSEFPSQILGGIELTFTDLSELYGKFIKDECQDIVTGNIDEFKSPLLTLSYPSETTIATAASQEAKNHHFFGKTGTSNNANDNWFVGFDGRHLFILWLGNEKREQQHSLELSGAWYAYRSFERYVLFRGRALETINCQLFMQGQGE